MTEYKRAIKDELRKQKRMIIILSEVNTNKVIKRIYVTTVGEFEKFLGEYEAGRYPNLAWSYSFDLKCEL